MSPPNVRRHLVCPGVECGHHYWLIDIGGNERCSKCGRLGQPICACGCGASLAGLRSDAVYRSEACAKRLQRRGRPDIDPTGHPLDDARGQVEEGLTAAQWALVAREHTMRTLLETDYFTADDLAVLNLPEHYRRSVHGLVTAFFRGPKPYMEEAGRRKSERPERKGGKNTIFRISAKGRRELPKLLTDTRREIASAGVGGGNAAELSSSGSVASAHSPHPGDSLPGGDAAPLPAPPGAVPGKSESLTLLPEPPNLTDPDQRRAA